MIQGDLPYGRAAATLAEMRGATFDAPGREATLHEFWDGYGWALMVTFLLLSWLAAECVRIADTATARRVLLPLILASAALALLSARYFFIVPATTLGLSSLALLTAMIRPPARSEATSSGDRQ